MHALHGYCNQSSPKAPDIMAPDFEDWPELQDLLINMVLLLAAKVDLAEDKSSFDAYRESGGSGPTFTVNLKASYSFQVRHMSGKW